MRKPPWKAENARIKRKLAERKEPRKVVHEVVQVPARTVQLYASQYFDSFEAQIIPEEAREEMAMDIITKKLAAQIKRENFLYVDLSRHENGGEQWRGSITVVRY